MFQGLTGQAFFESMAGEGTAVEFSEDARKRDALITSAHSGSDSQSGSKD